MAEDDELHFQDYFHLNPEEIYVPDSPRSSFYIWFENNTIFTILRNIEDCQHHSTRHEYRGVG